MSKLGDLYLINLILDQVDQDETLLKLLLISKKIGKHSQLIIDSLIQNELKKYRLHEKHMAERRWMINLQLIYQRKYRNWQSGWFFLLQGAGMGNHRDLAEWIMTVRNRENRENKGKYEHTRNYLIHLKFGLTGACFGGHREFAEWLFEKIPREYWDFNCMLQSACEGEKMEMAKWVVNLNSEKHAKPFEWKWSLWEATTRGNHDLVEFLIEHGACDWNYGLWAACFGRQEKMVKLMIEKGAKRCEYCHQSMDDHLNRFPTWNFPVTP